MASSSNEAAARVGLSNSQLLKAEQGRAGVSSGVPENELGCMAALTDGGHRAVEALQPGQ